MNDFCDECYEEVQGEKLEHCRFLKHNISQVLGKNEKKDLKKKESKRKNKKILHIKKGKKSYEYEILDKPIIPLRPINLLEDGTRMILVYLATKSKEINEKDDDDEIGIPEFSNKAYFIVAKEGIVSPKSVISIHAKEIQENYQVKIFDSWYQSRWNIKDLYDWLNNEKLTNPKELYDLIYATTKKYLDFENEYDYVYFILWNIGTYFYELFDAYPYNDYTGTKRAGKSKSMEFQKLVCYNAMMSADSSGSAMFRTIEGTGATILLDETEQMKNKNNENAQHIRTLILQGFFKNQYAIRSEGKAESGFTPVTYNLFSPKSLAHINSFDDVLEDRCIQQLMRRSKDKETLNSWCDERKDPSFRYVRNLCYRLFLDYANEIYDLQNEASNILKISGRELKLWTPIITLASFFEKHKVKNLIFHINRKTLQSSEDRQIQDEEESNDLKVIKFLDEVALTIPQDNRKESPEGWIPIGVLWKYLEDKSQDFSINTEYFKRPKLSHALRRLGLKRDRKTSGMCWLITKKEIKDVKERMGLLPLPSGQTKIS